MASLRIQMLGPISAWRHGDPLSLGSAAQRAVLGLLALAGGQPVPRTEMTAWIWHDRIPPASAANVIQTHVKHLRRLLEPDRPPRAPSAVLRQVGDGYALRIPASDVDALRFRQQVAAAGEAQRRGLLDRAVELLDAAFGMWHGPPLADVPALATHPKVVALTAERQAALVRYGEVLIAAGRAEEGLPALAEAAAAQPLNEACQAVLIRACHAAGRRGQAFAAYRDIRHRLAEELGVDPGPELAAAHAALLRDENPSEAGPAPPPDAGQQAAPTGRYVGQQGGPTTAPVPAQIPADLPDFTGRTAELARLDRLLGVAYRSAAARWTGARPVGGPAAVPIAALTGPAGVGKTALAVRWAHRAAHLFPDGQLYVNLRGFHPAGAMDPAEALCRFLEALDVPGERIPAQLDARAALYRSELAGRRVLILLDNARNAAQVRPLLPGVAGCAVLVTSRSGLSSLAAAQAAQPLPLDLLDTAEARDLLVRRLGIDRAAAEPRAVAEIVARCGGLPLALAVVAARAATGPNLPLAALADQLRPSRDRLDALATGDPDTDLRAVVSWSYRALSAQPARLFRLLGLHPGPDISAAAAVSLAGLPPSQVRSALAELVRTNLLAEQRPGRYALHDLLRAYAVEVAEQVDRERRRHAAAVRLVDHYLHSAFAADRLLYPVRDPIAPGTPGPGVAPERPACIEEAHAWFAAERAVLLAVLDRAAGMPGGRAWRLAWTLATYLDRRGHWDDLLATQRLAVAAAGRDGDASAQAGAYRSMARAYTRLGRLDDAHDQLARALETYRRSGDRAGQANTLLNMTLVWDRRGGHEEALGLARGALELFQAMGDRHGQARALNALGWHHALLGDPGRALAHCQRALGVFLEVGDRAGQATTWDSLGYARHHLGHYAESLVAYREAIELFRHLGDSHLEAMVLTHLGDAHRAAGGLAAARDAWSAALGILESLDRPEAERVRARLVLAAAPEVRSAAS